MTKSHLEGSTHEAIAIATIVKDQEVDLKHQHVDGHRDNNQADSTRDKVVQPGARRDLEIAPEVPELINGRGSNGRNDKESNPLDTSRESKSNAGQEKPNEPIVREGIVALIVKVDPGKDSERGEQNQGRIQQDEATLSDQTVLW